MSFIEDVKTSCGEVAEGTSEGFLLKGPEKRPKIVL